MDYLLGIDTSTTATKALLIDESGGVVASSSSDYDFDSPRPGWTEQPASLFWEGTVRAVRDVLAKTGVASRSVVAVGLTGQMHGMTLLDADGAVIRPVILWNDQRTAAQCAEIDRLVGANRVLELTGNPALTGFTAPKMLWVREHEPEAYRRVAKVLLPKDYVRYRLSGRFATDASDASGTSLLDVRQRTWSEEMVRALDVPMGWLPDVFEGPDVCARVSTEAALATGLAPGTPIVGGGGDQAASAVGAGIVRPGAVSVSLGTSGVVFAASDAYRTEPEGRLHAFCHAVPYTWHVMGVMLSAAGSLKWWRGVVNARSYDELTAAAATAPAGCEGLVFLPYLTGERTPHADPAARAAFVGLTVRHTQAHMTRAVLEGVCFGLRDSLGLVRGLGLDCDAVRVAGGGARSLLWRSILADVLGLDVATTNTTEGAAYGAALLAGVGVGVWPTVPAACDATVREADRVTTGANRAVYDLTYELFRSLYPTLAPAFRQATALPVAGR